MLICGKVRGQGRVHVAIRLTVNRECAQIAPSSGCRVKRHLKPAPKAAVAEHSLGEGREVVEKT